MGPRDELPREARPGVWGDPAMTLPSSSRGPFCGWIIWGRTVGDQDKEFASLIWKGTGFTKGGGGGVEVVGGTTRDLLAQGNLCGKWTTPWICNGLGVSPSSCAFVPGSFPTFPPTSPAGPTSPLPISLCPLELQVSFSSKKPICGPQFTLHSSHHLSPHPICLVLYTGHVFLTSIFPDTLQFIDVTAFCPPNNPTTAQQARYY